MTLGGEAPDGADFDLAAAIVGSEGTLGIVTEICVRLLPRPEAVKTMLFDFATIEAACRTVSAVIADGIVPAAMEIMDQHTVGLVEDWLHLGLPLDAGAVLLIEVDGPAVGLAGQVERIERHARAHGARSTRVAKDEAERAAIWRGRKSAFGAYGRTASGFYIMDGVVPRTRLAEALSAVYRMCAERGLEAGNVFHAGDGNLHPHVLFDARDPAAQAGGARGLARDPAHVHPHRRHHLGRARGRDREAPDDARAVRARRPRGDGAPARRVRPGRAAQPGQDPARRRRLPRGRARADGRHAAARRRGGAVDLSAPPRVLDPARAADPAAYAIGGRAPRARAAAGERGGGRRGAARRGRDGLAVVPWGGGVALARESAPPHYDLALDLRALDRIVEYEPEDFTLTAECGVTIATLRAALAARGQELPLEAPHAARATLGGVLAANAVGPRRLRFGAPRDRILGARFVLADGTLARTGGKVVKNVAGYGIHRLLCGSRGGLAVIVEASLKLSTAPARRGSRWPGAPTPARSPTPPAGRSSPGSSPRSSPWSAAHHAARLPEALRPGAPLPRDDRIRGRAGAPGRARGVRVRALGPPQARLESGDAAAAWQALADLETELPPDGARATAHNTPAALAPLLDAEAAPGLVFHAAGGRLLLPDWRGADPGAHGFAPLGGTDAVEGAPQQAVVALRTRIRSALDPAGVMAFGPRWARVGG